MDILTAFEDTMKDLERDDAHAKKQERRRTERKNREKYLKLLRRLFEARLVNQRTRWRDLVNGFDPAGIPGVPAESLQCMETEETKQVVESDQDLVKIVRDGLAKHNDYLDLIGQVGSTPLEYYEDLVKEEKDLLKHHKSSFKNMVKQNSIRMGSDTQFTQFDTSLSAHAWFSEQPQNIKILLYEYYVYKIKHKE